MTDMPPRPRIVTVGFYFSVVGAVFLMVGGLEAVTRTFMAFRPLYAPSVTDSQVNQILLFHRGAGVIYLLAGAALAYLAGRTRAGSHTLRRAYVGLSVGIVLVIFLAVIFARFALEVPALVAVIPIAVGATLMTRPTASAWFATDPAAGSRQDHPDG